LGTGVVSPLSLDDLKLSLGDVNPQLHARVNCALNVGIAHRVELHVGRLTRLLRLQVEGVAGRLRVDVMGDRVLVRKGDDVTLGDGDLPLGELFANLLDDRRAGKAGRADCGQGGNSDGSSWIPGC